MPRRSKNRYGRGTINPVKIGSGFACFLFHDGKRHRSQQTTLEAARAWIDMTESATGANRPPLTRVQMADAANAVSIMPPGFTLTDAARVMAERYGTSAITPTSLTDALSRFEAARAKRVKAVTIKGYRSAVKRLAVFAGGNVADVTAEQVEAFLDDLSPTTRNSVLRNLSAFFGWCKAKGLTRSVVTDQIEKARTVEPPKGVLTPAAAEALLREAEKSAPHFIPYFALGLFAGIRPGELARLLPEKISFMFVMLDGAVTKAASARTVRIRPNLRAWLDAYPPRSPIAPFNDRNRFRAIARIVKAAGIAWPPDCMRHSFATYAYDETHDAALVASEMGHAGTAIFFKHYRAMCHPGDGAKFFSIMPKIINPARVNGGV